MRGEGCLVLRREKNCAAVADTHKICRSPLRLYLNDINTLPDTRDLISMGFLGGPTLKTSIASLKICHSIDETEKDQILITPTNLITEKDQTF